MIFEFQDYIIDGLSGNKVRATMDVTETGNGERRTNTGNWKMTNWNKENNSNFQF